MNADPRSFCALRVFAVKFWVSFTAKGQSVERNREGPWSGASRRPPFCGIAYPMEFHRTGDSCVHQLSRHQDDKLSGVGQVVAQEGTVPRGKDGIRVRG